MLLMVREGPYDPEVIVMDEPTGPRGREVWSGSVEGITVVALTGAGVEVQPGEWYTLARFAQLLDSARAEGIDGPRTVYSAVTVQHAGVARPWEATIGIDELAAALMVCRSVVAHVRRLGRDDAFWVRVE